MLLPLLQTFKNMEQEVLLSVPEQVVKALDGRTQRWLALQVAIPESDLSKKLKGKMDFTSEELKSISTLLKTKIKLNG